MDGGKKKKRLTKAQKEELEFNNLAIGLWETMSPNERKRFDSIDIIKKRLNIFNITLNRFNTTTMAVVLRMNSEEHVLLNDAGFLSGLLAWNDVRHREGIFALSSVARRFLKEFTRMSYTRNYILKYYQNGQEIVELLKKL
jgi:hypothetical protein